jgi:hypothetical protein
MEKITSFSKRCEILADLWLNYKNDEQFQDFIEYNDLGLPLAYSIDNNIIEASPRAEEFIDEAFMILLAGLDAEDTGFESLDDLLDLS